MDQSLIKIERRRRQLQYITYFIILILTVSFVSLLFFVDYITDMFANLRYNIFLRAYLLVFIIASILYLSQKERQQDLQTKILMEELRDTSNRLAAELREDIFLNKISHKLNNLSSDEALEYLLASTKEFLDADGGTLKLKKADGQWEPARSASGPVEIEEDKLAKAVAQWVEQTGHSFFYPSEGVSAAALDLETNNISSILGVALRLKGKLFGVVTFWRSKLKAAYSKNELNLLQIIARQAAATAFNRQVEKEKCVQFKELLRLLAKAIDERNPDIKNHSEQSVKWTKKIAEQLGLALDEIETIETAAILQNIGYLAFPRELFSQATLTDEENAALEDHPRYGAKMLRALKFPRRITDIVLLHHEWADGSRPLSINKHDIPIGARIIAVVDAFIGLSQQGEGLDFKKALNQLQLLGNEQFDSEVVKALGKTITIKKSLSA